MYMLLAKGTYGSPKIMNALIIIVLKLSMITQAMFCTTSEGNELNPHVMLCIFCNSWLIQSYFELTQPAKCLLFASLVA